jgi:hypothetical protein
MTEVFPPRCQLYLPYAFESILIFTGGGTHYFIVILISTLFKLVNYFDYFSIQQFSRFIKHSIFSHKCVQRLMKTRTYTTVQYSIVALRNFAAW